MADTEQSNKGGNPDSDVGEQGRAGDTVSSGSQSTSKFSGQIFGPGISDNATKDRATSTAGYALQKELHQTPNHVWMAYFTGASCTKTTNPWGAYSVVFRDHSPNSSDHGKLAQMAWHMTSSFEVVNEKKLAGLAIAQALYIADQRLRSLPHNEERPKKATVKVFTHCVETLKNIDDPSGIEGAGRESQLEVVKLIEDLSCSLCNIVGINVRLYLQWMPAEYGKMVCARDFAKRCRRRRKSGRKDLKSGRKDLFFVGNEGRDAALMPESVFGFIERDTAEESHASMVEESEAAVSMAQEEAASTAEVVMEDASTAEVVMEEVPVEELRPVEGQADVDQETNHDDENLEEAQVTASEQVPSDEQVPNERDEQVPNNVAVSNEEQALVNQQILADCYEQQIQFLRDQGNQDVANQQMWGELADGYADELRQLVPDHLLPSPPSP